MIFASPGYLLLLIVIPALAWYLIRFGRRSSSSLQYSVLAPVRQLGHAPSAVWRRLRGGSRLLALVALILGLARPQQGLKSDTRDIRATDILLCMDVSDSMRAEDYPPRTRIALAKEAAKKFIEKRGIDRIGLALFARFSMSQCPLTTDYSALMGLLERVKIGDIPGDRTAIGDGLATCVERLKDSQARSKIIVLLTDGANNAGNVDPVTAADVAASFGIKVYAIGAGSPKGGYVTIRDPIFGARRVRIADSLDEGTLERIASATGGKYFRAVDKKALHAVFAEIDQLEKSEIKVRQFTQYLERFEWFLLAGLLLFAAELAVGQVLIREVP